MTSVIVIICLILNVVLLAANYYLDRRAKYYFDDATTKYNEALDLYKTIEEQRTKPAISIQDAKKIIEEMTGKKLDG